MKKYTTILAAIVLSVTSTFSCKKEDTKPTPTSVVTTTITFTTTTTSVTKPWVDFTMSGTPVVGDTMRFICQSNKKINTYHWSFGDGTISTEANPLHIYSTPGSYYVLLKINNDSASEYHIIDISSDPVYTYKVAGKRLFRDCKVIVRTLGGQETTKQLPDSVLDITYIDKITIRLFGIGTFVFNSDKSGANLLFFEIPNVPSYVPGNIVYYIAEDSISLKNVTSGTVKGGFPDNVVDYTFSCHAP